jgi:purine catabolism regulator
MSGGDIMIVADLLKKTYFPDFRVLAGTEGLTREITSVSVIDSPDVDRWMRGGEFLIGSGYIFRDDPDGMMPFMRLAAKKNIAAFGLKIDRYHTSPPQTVIDEAEHLKLPLIEIPLRYRWVDINEIVYSVLLSEKRNIPKFRAPEHHHLWHEINDTHRILASLATELECPLAVSVPKLNIRNFFAPDGTVSDSPAAERIFSAPDLAERELPRHNPVLVSLRKIAYEGGNRWIALYRQELFSLIEVALVLPAEEHYPSIHQERMIFRAIGIIQGAILESSSFLQEKPAQKEQFLQNLCLGTYNNSKMILGRARELGIDLPEDLFVLQIASVDKGHLPPWHPPFSLTYKMANQWVCLVTPLEFEQHRDHLMQVAGEQGLWIATGGETKGWEQIQRSYEEAKRALTWIREFEPVPGIYPFSELALHTFLRKIVTLPEADGLWQRFWEPLVTDASKRKAVPLLEVAKALIRSDFNAKKCAEMLHLHYNTVRNNISDLETLLRVDLKNRLHRFALSLAYYVHISRERKHWEDII